MRELRRQDFDGREGETWEVAAPAGSVALELSRVEGLPQAVREAGSFRLEWLGPAEPLLDQGIYTFTRGGEADEIFIVPIAQTDGGVRYEAIFN